MSTKQNELKLAREVHRSILLVQRRMRRARFAYPFPLQTSQAILLSSMSAADQLSPSKLEQISGMARNTVSRLLIELEKLRWVASIRSGIDGRVKLYHFTELGAEKLARLMAINNDSSIRTFSPLNEQEQKFYCQLVRTLADGLDCPPRKAPPGEFHILTQQHRVVWGTRMIGRNYLHTGLELPAFQLLFELFRRNEPVRFNELLTLLPFHQSKLSRSLSAFERRGLVKKSTPANDRRGLLVTLSEKGRGYFEDLERNIAAVYAQALTTTSMRELDKFVTISRQVISAPLPGPTSSSPDALPTADQVEHRRLGRIRRGDRESMLTLKQLPRAAYSCVYYQDRRPCGVLVIGEGGSLDCFEFQPEGEYSLIEEQRALREGLAHYFASRERAAVKLPKALADRLHLPSVIRRKPKR